VLDYKASLWYMVCYSAGYMSPSKIIKLISRQSQKWNLNPIMFHVHVVIAKLIIHVQCDSC